MKKLFLLSCLMVTASIAFADVHENSDDLSFDPVYTHNGAITTLWPGGTPMPWSRKVYQSGTSWISEVGCIYTPPYYFSGNSCQTDKNTVLLKTVPL